MSDETKKDNSGKATKAQGVSTSRPAILPEARTVSASTSQPVAPPPKPAWKRAHILVLGNEKGGSGKTTTAMHLITGLLHQGYTVGSMDLDGRQRSLTRYVENRQVWMDQNSVSLPMPAHTVIARSELDTVTEREADERARFEFE